MLDLRVSFDSLSGYSVFVACIGLASAFVLSLYAVSPGLPRNHPVTVRRRIAAILCVSLLAPVYVWAWSSHSGDGGEQLWRVLGWRLEGLLWAVASPLLLVLMAYLGPIVQLLSEGENPFDVSQERSDISARNYIVAPFCEEFVFRACMVPLLLPHLGVFWTILLCPLFFGVAHLHHFFEWLWNGDTSIVEAVVGLIAQVGYTSIFGMFSAFLFVRTGHLVSPVLAHALCNMLGLPPVDRLMKHPHRVALATLYVVGLLTFILLLAPMTEPTWFRGASSLQEGPS